MNKVTNLRLWAALLILFSMLTASVVLAPSVCLAQEEGVAAVEEAAAEEGAAPPEEPATEQPTTEAPTSTEAEVVTDEAMEDLATDDSTDAPEDVEVEEEVAEEVPAGSTSESGQGDAETSSDAAGADAAAVKQGMSPYLMAGIILALFIIPGFIGSSLGKSLKMPDHGWKIAVVIGVAAAGILAVVSAMTRDNGFKLGPDLGGGVTLIYDLADPKLLDDEGQPKDPDAEETEGRRDSFSMDEMLAALKKRVDPSGTKEVTIRSRGKSVEIIIPKAGEAELEYIKKKITDLGQLEFRILADRNRNEFKDQIELALRLPPGQTVAKVNGNPVARWVEYDIDEFGPLDQAPEAGDERDRAIVKRMGVHAPEILVVIDPFNVTGEYLDGASKDVGPEGFQVQFRFNTQGSSRFGKLTGKYVPNPSPYFLGIILDEQLLSAPSIRSKITNVGTISGRNMDEEEVEHVVSILDAGSLPAALNKTPVSETLTGPEIGELTIKQGTRAMIVSMSIVLLFILFYYRFAGIVACLALVLNIVLVVGAMVLLNAAFTLPGLAGLVLTVGMSVDANVLIFERIREELARGATLRMAIRNGFGRATTTIVDANVTTLITGVVLYVIGTDQIKGFAITLILGIIMSMYTAIFCSRLLFDIAERRGWITKLSMMHLLSRTDIQFMSKWPVATALSLLVIVVGMFGVVSRQSNLLNIDFTGGTSVTMVLQEDHAMSQGEVRTALEEPLKGKNLLVVERKQDGPEGTTFKIDCSVLDDVDAETGETIPNAVEHVEEILKETFKGKLETYQLRAEPIEAFAEGDEGENQYAGYQTTLVFGEESDSEALVGVSHDTLMDEVRDVLADMNFPGVAPVLTNPDYSEGSSRRFASWKVRLAGVDQSQAQAIFDEVVARKNGDPIFPLANKIGGRVAGDMRLQAIYAIGVSLLGIIGYIWIRFQKISYGLAAVVALVHDVLVTLGIIALSAYLVEYAYPLANALQVDAFQISLPIVAAFLTIIGYSLNDTIVVFDRIREVRGKSPNLTAEMINTSVNQTLSRTLLTSLTTLIVVVILYFFGGDGIHAFAFALVIGVIVGTYSSIFIASPVLLWLSKKEQNWTV